MVEVFLKEILCWESELSGLYGHTKGRLTLHLHSLLWVKNVATPQEIRDKIMGGDSLFQQKLIEYLESAHQGDFIHGSMADVRKRVNVDPEAGPEEEDLQSGPMYTVPTKTLPSVPPPLCDEIHTKEEDCSKCQCLADWWLKYEHKVDNILLRSNMGICKARFPREIFKSTHIDENGHINIKKAEPQINTFSHVLTYFSRSNTDVTRLLSGMAVKAVVSYVSDYVSKLGLKTYQAFASVFDPMARGEWKLREH
ncbi:hypothetical protein C8R44DRAFT_835772 [Mycena epipterygia]|nr:hypothetical protein C8R44DRAFT_835772 [Mycena epipterygia]